MKKSIVFINQASGYLTVDIVNAFTTEFEKVYLITSPIRIQERELHPKVKVIRTFRHSRKSNFHRLIKWVLSTIHIFFLLLLKIRNSDIFYISIPPMSYWCSLFLKNKFSILIFDVYPDVLSSFGVKKTNVVYSSWAKVNKKIFSRAHKLYTLSDDLAATVKKYAENNQPFIINNWTGFSDIIDIPKNENTFIQANSLVDKFVVQYAGNVSKAHNVDVILDLAEKTEANKDIVYLIIGRGNHLEALKERKLKQNLENVMFLPFQPDNVLKYSLSSADLSMVVVGDEVAEISVPSKIYNLQSLSIPILGISKKNSELEKHLTKYNNGRCFKNDDLDSILEYVSRCKEDKDYLCLLKKNSALAAEDFSYKNAEKYLLHYK